LSKVPSKCTTCLNYDPTKKTCRVYDEFPGEGHRVSTTECSSFLDQDNDQSLSQLAQYLDTDPDSVVSAALTRAVDKVLDGYSEKMKVMVIGIARRKVKACIRMVDVIDNLLDSLDNSDTMRNMTPGQSIRLLSELNASVNMDLSFIMKILQPDSTFKDIQMYFDQRTTIIQPNGASPETNSTSDMIATLPSTSRENIRKAFDVILHSIHESESKSGSTVDLVSGEEEEHDILDET
jgi:hypothetical protein